ncbi:MAG: hypothetical protein AB8B56_01710 [Crocinitomicaceae bacterium]
MKPRFIIILFTAALIFGCSKSRKERRIHEGVWVIKDYRVNGVDSTESVLYEDIVGYKFVLDGSREDRKDNSTFDRIYAVMENGQELNFGHWGERDKKKMMLEPEYALMENLPSKPFVSCGCFPTYDIVYIKKDEMKYSIEYDGISYDLTFEKK